MIIYPRLAILLVHTPFNWKRPLTLISYLIRKVTGSYWNHCAVLIEIEGVLFIVESDIKGVTMLPYKNWVKEQEIAVYYVSDALNKRGKLLEKVGNVGYSFKDLFWFMPIYLLTGQFYGQKVDGYSNKPTCYEFAAWWLGIQDWYKMTPDKFINNLKVNKYISRFEGIFKAKEYETKR